MHICVCNIVFQLGFFSSGVELVASLLWGHEKIAIPIHITAPVIHYMCMHICWKLLHVHTCFTSRDACPHQSKARAKQVSKPDINYSQNYVHVALHRHCDSTNMYTHK